MTCDRTALPLALDIQCCLLVGLLGLYATLKNLCVRGGGR